ncbi:MAG TPA: hypothetical protein VLF60_02040 [Candidatus Saccharimonadales bacterium]|nr:hypothetical protein [Candidatus Saccharimonadales bacterium]
MRLVRIVDDLLDRITMYRLVLYGLGLLVSVGVGLSYAGTLSISGNSLILSTATLLGVCYITNRGLAFAWDAASNSESSLITALILACILPPATSLRIWIAIALAGMLAIASKYLIAFRAKHLFNPAAIAVLALSLANLLQASWWVGSKAMLPYTLVLGLLVVRKLRRFQLVASFTAAALAVMVIIGHIHGHETRYTLSQAFTSWPLIFFGTIMLTEPATMPPRNRTRVMYGLLVGSAFASQLHLDTIAATPEAALVFGNFFAYLVSPRYKLRLRLASKTQMGPRILDLRFTPDRIPTFLPGQYIEVTLPHPQTDGRGNRRTFTIASSPTESTLALGVRFYTPSSSFKQALARLNPGDKVIAGQIAGDFVLPTDPSQKLVFIAGGIGITPFRSMLKYLIDTEQQRDILLLYFVSDPADVSYRDVLAQAAAIGARVKVFVKSHLTADQLRTLTPNYADTHFYISGPNHMVETNQALLQQMSIPRQHIRTDHFSGY